MTAAPHPDPGPGERAPSGRLAALARWADWPIAVKLLAVVLVPLVVAIVLGVLVITGDVSRANGDMSVQVTGLSTDLRAAVTALEAERLAVAAPGAPPPGDPRLGPVRSATDATLATLDSAASPGVLDQDATAAWAALSTRLAGLAATRGPGGTPAERVAGYTSLIDAALAFDRALASTSPDAATAALHDLAAAREEVSYQQALVLVASARGALTGQEVTALRNSQARLAARLSDVAAEAPAADVARLRADVPQAALDARAELARQAVDQSGAGSVTIPVPAWNAANATVTGGLDAVTGALAREVAADAAARQDAAGAAAGLATVSLFAALVAAATIMVFVGRQLLRSIALLRRAARDIADHELPETVERIRRGDPVDAEVRPVPVDTADEVGQLARAFDAMHAEAVRLAVEQASLRGNYADLFVNLSRRSQSLVQRQLRLIERLERDEEDPDQLDALFTLDHLATRMRRNNENLMVLSGMDLGRGTSHALPLADLLRASVSEIEHYRRVTVQPPPPVHVTGFAAGDLVRLVAELLDNATAFSSPDTAVTVASHSTKGRAVVIDIVDHGLGMTDDELESANRRLTRSSGVEERVSRRMGLFVVGRLANKHGIRVRLHGGDDIPGLRVTVTVPAELMVPEPGEPLPSWPTGDTDGRPANGESHHPSWGDQAAMTVTIPRVVDPEPTGLFTAHLAATPPPEQAPVPRGGPETTPIFDDMASLWFDDSHTGADPDEAAQDSPAAEPVGAPEPPAEQTAWTFAADDGWRAVRELSSSAPPDVLTTAGLPRREPLARLLPGSVGGARERAPESPAPAGDPGIDADLLRDRLTGFQRGIRRGRDEQGGAHTRVEERMPVAPGVPAYTDAGLPRRRPRPGEAGHRVERENT